MSGPGLGEDLETRLEALGRTHRGAEPEDIVERVARVMASINGDLSSVNLKLYTDLEIFGEAIGAGPQETESRAEAAAHPGKPKTDPMSGPQSPENAISQDDADALLANAD
ncbi:MAG: hypothetical protein ACE5KF_08675 [Kiloniellaceae bacterium]